MAVGFSARKSYQYAYTAQKELDEKAAIDAGLQEKSQQFVQLGSEIYTKA